jgi:hypothetical protein
MDGDAEFKMMLQDPQALWDLYFEQVASGTPLSEDQLVKFEYLKKTLKRTP